MIIVQHLLLIALGAAVAGLAGIIVYAGYGITKFFLTQFFRIEPTPSDIGMAVFLIFGLLLLFHATGYVLFGGSM